MSRFVGYTGHYTCTLFADGAGAVVLGAGREPGFMAGQRIARGEFYDALGIYPGGGISMTCSIWIISAGGRYTRRIIS